MSSYLFAWLLFLGLSLGALGNLMLHELTGGPWYAAVRPPLLAAARLVPLAALLGIPVLAGMHSLYPIGSNAWFTPAFFVARSVLFLLIWSGLSLLYPRTTLEGRKVLSAIGLIAYVFTVSIAATDWIASLVPQWYSTGLGLVVASGQMLGAMALAVAYAAFRGRPEAREQVFIDLGNLLLMYVLLWAYVAFMQFLIIWVGNLPREISWYVPRLQTGWVSLAIFLVVAHFFAPLLILLFRSAKRAPVLLGVLAAGLLIGHIVDVYWLIAPSVRPDGFRVAWADPVALAAAAALWWFAWRPRRA